MEAAQRNMQNMQQRMDDTVRARVEGIRSAMEAELAKSQNYMTQAVDEAHRQTNAAETRAAESAARMEELKVETDRMKPTIQQLQSDLDVMAKKVNDLSREKLNLSTQYERLKDMQGRTKDVHTTELKRVMAEKAGLQAQLEAYAKTLQDKEAQLAQLRKDSSSEMSRLNAEVSALTGQLTRAQEQYAVNTEKFNLISDACARSADTLAEVRAAADKQYLELQQQSEAREREHRSKVADMNKVFNAQLEATRMEAEADASKQNEAILALQNEMRKISETRDQLKASLASYVASLKGKEQELAETQDRLNKTKTDDAARRLELSQQLSKMQEERDALVRNCDQRVDAMRLQQTQLQDMNETKLGIIAARDAQIAKMDQTVKELLSQQAAAKAQVEAAWQQNQKQWNDKVAALKAQHKQRIQQQSDQLRKSTSAVAALRAQHDRRTVEFKQKERDMMARLAQAQAAQQRAQVTHTAAIATLQDKIQNMTAEATARMSEYKQLEAERNELTRRITANERAFLQEAKRLTDMTDKIKLEKSTLQAKLDSMSKEKQELDQAKRQAEQRLADTAKRLEAMTAAQAATKREVERIARDSQTALDRQKAAMEKSASSKLVNLTSALEKTQAELNNRAGELESMKDAMQKLRAEAQRAMDDHKVLSDTKLKLEAINASLTARNKELDGLYQTELKAKNDHAEKTARVRQQLDEATKNMTVLQATVEATNLKMRSLQETHNAEMEAAKRRLAQVEAAMAKSMGQAADQRKSMEAAAGELRARLDKVNSELLAQQQASADLQQQSQREKNQMMMQHDQQLSEQKSLVNSLRLEMQEIKRTKDAMERSHAELQKAVTEARNQAAQFQRELGKAQAALESCRSADGQCAAQLDELRRDHKRMEDGMGVAQKMLDQCKSDAQKCRMELTTKCNKLGA